MAITPLPPAPQRNQPATFADAGDAFLGALPAFAVEAEAARLEINNRATAAATDALAAADSAVAAAGGAAAAGAVAWVSGTTYAAGDVRYSPLDLQSYRRSTNGAGTIDPATDPANWVRVTLTGAGVRVARSSDTVLTVSDNGRIFDLSGTWTLTVDAAIMRNGWYAILRNTSNGDITVDVVGAQLIDGAAAYTLKPGFVVLLSYDGSAFNVLTLKARTYDNIAQFAASGSFVVPPDTYALRAYSFGAGASGTLTNSGGGGGCAYGDLAVTPGETVTLTIASGAATVTSAGVDRLTANPAAGTTAGTASKHASVTNGGAYSGGAGGAGGGGASSGSPLGAGVNGSQGPGSGWGGAGSSSSFGGGGGVGTAGGIHRGGDGLPVDSIDPLLRGLTALGGVGQTVNAVRGGSGGAGGGGGNTGHTPGGAGGFGGGGGIGGGAYSTGGAGGFGGGGGIGWGADSTGGAGGFGGGGGGGSSAGGAGGAAVIRIYY